MSGAPSTVATRDSVGANIGFVIRCRPLAKVRAIRKFFMRDVRAFYFGDLYAFLHNLLSFLFLGQSLNKNEGTDLVFFVDHLNMCTYDNNFISKLFPIVFFHRMSVESHDNFAAKLSIILIIAQFNSVFIHLTSGIGTRVNGQYTVAYMYNVLT